MGNASDHRKLVGGRLRAARNPNQDQQHSDSDDKSRAAFSRESPASKSCDRSAASKFRASPIGRRIQAGLARHLTPAKGDPSGRQSRTSNGNDNGNDNDNINENDGHRVGPAGDDANMYIKDDNKDDTKDKRREKEKSKLRRLSPFRLSPCKKPLAFARSKSPGLINPSQQRPAPAAMTHTNNNTLNDVNFINKPHRAPCDSAASSPASLNSAARKYSTRMIMGQMLITTNQQQPQQSPLKSCSSYAASASPTPLSLASQTLATSGSPGGGTLAGPSSMQVEQLLQQGEQQLSSNLRATCNCDQEDDADDLTIPFEHPTKISHGFWLQRYSNLHRQDKKQAHQSPNNKAKHNTNQAQAQIQKAAGPDNSTSSNQATGTCNGAALQTSSPGSMAKASSSVHVAGPSSAKSPSPSPLIRPASSNSGQLKGQQNKHGQHHTSTHNHILHPNPNQHNEQQVGSSSGDQAAQNANEPNPGRSLGASASCSEQQQQHFFARCRDLVARRLRAAGGARNVASSGQLDDDHDRPHRPNNHEPSVAGDRPRANPSDDEICSVQNNKINNAAGQGGRVAKSGHASLAPAPAEGQSACRWFVKHLTSSPLRKRKAAARSAGENDNNELANDERATEGARRERAEEVYQSDNGRPMLVNGHRPEWPIDDGRSAAGGHPEAGYSGRDQPGPVAIPNSKQTPITSRGAQTNAKTTTETETTNATYNKQLMELLDRRGGDEENNKEAAAAASKEKRGRGRRDKDNDRGRASNAGFITSGGGSSNNKNNKQNNYSAAALSILGGSPLLRRLAGRVHIGAGGGGGGGPKARETSVKTTTTTTLANKNSDTKPNDINDSAAMRAGPMIDNEPRPGQRQKGEPGRFQGDKSEGATRFGPDSPQINAISDYVMSQKGGSNSGQNNPAAAAGGKPQKRLEPIHQAPPAAAINPRGTTAGINRGQLTQVEQHAAGPSTDVPEREGAFRLEAASGRRPSEPPPPVPVAHMPIVKSSVASRPLECCPSKSTDINYKFQETTEKVDGTNSNVAVASENNRPSHDYANHDYYREELEQVLRQRSDICNTMLQMSLPSEDGNRLNDNTTNKLGQRAECKQLIPEQDVDVDRADQTVRMNVEQYCDSENINGNIDSESRREDDASEQREKYSSLIRPVPSCSPSISSIDQCELVGVAGGHRQADSASQQSSRSQRSGESRVVAFEIDHERAKRHPAAASPKNSRRSSKSNMTVLSNQVDTNKQQQQQVQPAPKINQVAPAPQANSGPSAAGVGSQLATNIKRLIKRQQSVDSYRMARELKNKIRRQQEANSVTGAAAAAATPGSSARPAPRPASAAAGSCRSPNPINSGNLNNPNKQAAHLKPSNQPKGSAGADESFLAATKRKASVCAGSLARARGTLNFARPNWAESLVLAESNETKSDCPKQPVDPINLSIKINTATCDTPPSHDNQDSSKSQANDNNDKNNSNNLKPKPPNSLNLSINSGAGGRDGGHPGAFVVGSFSGSITPTYPTHHLPSSHYVVKKYSNASTISSSMGANETSSIAANSSLYLGLDLSLGLDGASSPGSHRQPVSDTDTSMATSPQPSAVLMSSLAGGEPAAAATIPAAAQQLTGANEGSMLANGAAVMQAVPANATSGPLTPNPILSEDEATQIARRANLAEGIYENKVGLGEDMKFLASLPELCDITFLVGESREPVCAVKSVLAARSRVFHKILFGSRIAGAGGRYQLQTVGKYPNRTLIMNRQPSSKSSVETSIDEPGLDPKQQLSGAELSGGRKFLVGSRKSSSPRSTSPKQPSKQQQQLGNHKSLDNSQGGGGGNWSVTLNMSGYSTSRSPAEAAGGGGAKQSGASGRASVASGRDSSLSSHQGSQDPLLVVGPGQIAGPVKSSGRSSKSSFRNRTTNWITSKEQHAGESSGGGGGGRRFSRIFMKRISDSSIKHHNNKQQHHYQGVSTGDTTGSSMVSNGGGAQRRSLLHHNNSLGAMMLGSSSEKNSHEHHHQHQQHQRKRDLERMSKSLTSTTMIIEEFEPDVFRQLIEYIHTGCVLLQARTLLGLLNAADYYGLEQLRKACLRFVSCCINVDTVCSLLATAERYIQYKCTKSIVQKVLEFVDSHADEIFKLNAFGLLPEHVVRLILARDGLQADELVKYNGVYTWCEHYCRAYEVANIADVMRNFLDMIQFHKIPTQALLADIYPARIVPDNIFLSALAFQAQPSKFGEHAQTLKARRMTLPNPVLSKLNSMSSDGEEGAGPAGNEEAGSAAAAEKKRRARLLKHNKQKTAMTNYPDGSESSGNEQQQDSGPKRGASFRRKQRKPSRPSAGASLMVSLFQMGVGVGAGDSQSAERIERSHSSSSNYQAAEAHASSSKSTSPGFSSAGHAHMKQASTKRKGSIAQAGISELIKFSHKLSIKRRQSSASPNLPPVKSRLGLLHKKAPGIYMSDADPMDPNDPLSVGQKILNAYLLEQGRREAEEARRRAAEETKRRQELSQCSRANPIVNIGNASSSPNANSAELDSKEAQGNSADCQQSVAADHSINKSSSSKSSTNLARRSSNRKSFRDFKHISKRIFSRHQSSKQLEQSLGPTGAQARADCISAPSGNTPGPAAGDSQAASSTSKESKKRIVFKIKRSETVFEATSCP